MEKNTNCLLDKLVISLLVTLLMNTIIWTFFIQRSTFVGSAWSFFFFIPAKTANDLRLWRIFYPRFYPLHLFSYLNSWERAIIFPFECSVLNMGTTGTIFITSLVWRGPWLGIEPELEASTLPLGYRGGGCYWFVLTSYWLI